MASSLVRSVVAVITTSLLIVAFVVVISSSNGTSTSSEIAPTEDLEDVTFCWRKARSYTPRGTGKTKMKCGQTYGSSNCEKVALLWYPKCRSGYHHFGCCMCVEKPPVPPGWVKCGLGAAVDRSTCKIRVKNQVLSVFKSIAQIGVLIASGGTSAAASEAAETADAASKAFEAFSDPTSVLVEASGDKDVKDLYEMVQKAKEYGDAVNDAVEAGNTAQATRAIEEAAAVVDPTGLADVAVAFTYPDCSPSYGGR